ncbi:MAG: DUF4097 family beta strand repeat-containing protein [Opitutaceae bacterium]|nr:DUF4097 family beta strand repeat-containing protein [Opitutaceae bacterium]
MNSPIRFFSLFALALGVLAGSARATESGTPFIVGFSDPAKSGTLKVDLLWADLHIRGSDSAEVRILTTMPSRGAATPQPDGLRRLDKDVSFDVVEKNNVITLTIGDGGIPSTVHDAQFEIEVPKSTALVLRTEAGGDIRIDNVEGDIDINSMNGEVILNGVAGSTVVNTMNGGIKTTYKSTPQKPVSLSSMNGEIALQLPADTKANVRLRTHNGAIYTDFPESAMPTRSEGRGGEIDPATAKAVAQATHEAARAAAEAARAAVEIAREVAHEVRQSLEENRAAPVPRPTDRIAPPKPPRPPWFTGHNILGGKTVSGTLNGGGVDIHLSSMNGTIIVREAK